MTQMFSVRAHFRHVGILGDYVAHAKSYGDLVILVRTGELGDDGTFQVFRNHRGGRGFNVIKLGEFASQEKLAVNRFASFLAEQHISYTKLIAEPEPVTADDGP
jgi:hypothetical protein